MTRAWVWITAALILMFGAGYSGYAYFEKPSFDRYAPVIAAAAHHQVDVNEAGIIDLSKKFPGITEKNNAFVTWNDDGSFRLMFPTYYGEGSQLAGVMYTSRPLTDDDVHYRDGVISFTKKLVVVGSYGYLRLEKKLNDNWYEVSYKLQK